MNDVSEIALFSDDAARAAGFYRLFLGSDPVAEWPGGAVFAAGGVKILVHDRAAGVDGGPPNEDHFAVAVADLDRACACLRMRGIDLLMEPREYPWGRSAYARDPDGRLVELTQA